VFKKVENRLLNFIGSVQFILFTIYLGVVLL